MSRTGRPGVGPGLCVVFRAVLEKVWPDIDLHGATLGGPDFDGVSGICKGDALLGAATVSIEVAVGWKIFHAQELMEPAFRPAVAESVARVVVADAKGGEFARWAAPSA